MKKKRLLSMLLCLVLVMSLFTGLEVSASADDVITHTAANGDYLFKVCKSYGLDYYQCKQAIMALNGFTSEQQLNKISVGQQIKLPASNAVAATVKASTVTTTTVATTTTVGGTTTTTTTTSAVSGALGGYNVAFYLVPHVVSSGETLNGICNGLGTSYTANSAMILGMNGISNANNIKAGKNVYIPTTTAPASGNCYAVIEHTVSSGENLTSICSQYGVNYAANAQLISGLNAGKDVSRIYANQKLYIPVATSGIGVVTPGISSPSTVAPGVQGGYTISFDATNYGSPFATVDGAKVTAAKQGAKVQIVSNADAGYNIKSVSVMRLDTRANLLVSENSFVMPASNVAVTVMYSPAMRLTKAVPTNGRFALLVNGSDESYANYGDVISVLPTPDSSYAVAKVTYKKSADGTNEKSVYPDANGDYKFNMPNYPVTVTVTFTKASFYKITTTKTGTGTGDVAYAYNGSTITKAAANTKVTVNLKPADGSVVRSVKVNGKAIDDADNFGLTKVNDNCYTFKMPEAPVTVTVDFYKVVTYSISVGSYIKGGTCRIAVYDLETDTAKFTNKAKAGNVVIVVPDPSSGKYFDYAKSAVVYANKSSSVTLNAFDPAYSGYTFIMPAADVLVEPYWSDGAVRYKISTSEITNGTCYYVVDDGTGNPNSGVTSAASKDVEIRITPKAGYSVALDSNSQYSVYYYDTAWHYATRIDDTHYKFTMPAHDVKVRILLDKAWDFVNITKNVDKIGNVTPGTIDVWCENTKLSDSALNARVGEYLVFVVNAKEGYALKTLTVNGNKVGVTGGATKLSDTKYAYTVQTSDKGTGIAVNATFEAANYTIQYSDPRSTHGSKYEIYVDGVNKGSADVTDAHVGQKVELKITVGALDTLDQVIVDGIDVTADVESNVYTYTMKAAKSVTKVTFKDTAATKLTYSISAGTLEHASVTFGKTTAEPGEAISVTTTPAAGYDVKSVVLRDAYNNDITSAYWTGPGFTMPSCDVTVEVIAEPLPYKVSTGTLTNVASVTFTPSGNVQTDKVVTLEVTPVDGFTFTGFVIKDASNTDVTASYKQSETSFKMPPFDVTVDVSAS